MSPPPLCPPSPLCPMTHSTPASVLKLAGMVAADEVSEPEKVPTWPLASCTTKVSYLHGVGGFRVQGPGSRVSRVQGPRFLNALGFRGSWV